MVARITTVKYGNESKSWNQLGNHTILNRGLYEYYDKNNLVYPSRAITSTENRHKIQKLKTTRALNYYYLIIIIYNVD